jgi:hypothetical protein
METNGNFWCKVEVVWITSISFWLLGLLSQLPFRWFVSFLSSLWLIISLDEVCDTGQWLLFTFFHIFILSKTLHF